MRRFLTTIVILLAVSSSFVFPVGAQEKEQPQGYSCALHVAPDGSLYSTPVDFPLPVIPEGSPSLARGPHSNIVNGTVPARIIPQATLQSLDENFTNIIWPNDTVAFGTPPYNVIQIIITTQDGTGGVAGYFSSGDPDAIYLDYDDLNLDLDVTAHEFQHLIHNSKGGGGFGDEFVNEGCSEYGIYTCYGANRPGLTNHWGAYASFTDDDFTQWDTVGDYGSAGLYLIYCADRYGGTAFTKALVADFSSGISGYNNQLQPKGTSFTEVFKKWVVTNWINNKTIDQGQWGYANVTNLVGYTNLEKNHPCTCSSVVSQGWAADYIRFEPPTWGQNCGDLQVNITFNSGTGYAAICKVGKAGTGTPDAVEVLSLSANKGSGLISNLGGSYAVGCLVLSGLSSGATYTYSTRIVDLTPPTTLLAMSPAIPNGKNGWYTSKPSISLTSNEPGSTYCHWDSVAEAKYTGPVVAQEGNHTFYYRSVDLAGNWEPVVSKVVRVDLTVPVSTLTVDPATPTGENGWYKSAPTLTLSCDTPEANVTFAWDGSSFEKYTGPIKPQEGIHTFNYRAIDVSGLIESPRALVTRVDSSLPIVCATLAPFIPDGQNLWYLKAPSINITCNDIATPTIFYRWDGGSENIYYTDIKAIDGIHTITYWARDCAGNLGPESSLTVKTDTILPVINITSDPVEPDGLCGWFTKPTTVSFKTDEPGNVTIYYRWDGDQKNTYTDKLDIPEGNHILYVYGIDEAGNKGKEFFRYFKLDTSKPVTNIKIEPEDMGNGWYHSKPVVTLSCLNDQNNVTIQYSLDGSTMAKYTKTVDMGDGIHTMTFYAADEAGNTELRVERKFKVDTKAPQLAASVNRVNATTSDTIYATADARDDNGVQDFLFDFGDGTAAEWSQSSNVSHKYSTAGEYYIKVKVRDKSGLETSATPVKIQINNPSGGGGGGGGGVGGAGNFLSKIPTFVWLMLLALIIIIIVGYAASKVYKSHRRKILFREVEKAEQEREKRHTMEIWERPEEEIRPSNPGIGAFRAPAYESDVSSGGSPGYGDTIAEPAYAPLSTRPSVVEPGTAPDYGNVKVLERKQVEEVPLETEVGASKPIWATSGKKAEPTKVAAAPKPQPVAAPRPAPKPEPQNPELSSLVKQLSSEPSAPAKPAAPPPKPQPAPKLTDTSATTSDIADILKKLDAVTKGRK